MHLLKIVALWDRLSISSADSLPSPPQETPSTHSQHCERAVKPEQSTYLITVIKINVPPASVLQNTNVNAHNVS